MKVYLKGKGEITLTQKNYLAQGGEGTVWVHGNSVLKIYHDPANMIPVDKIIELSELTDPHIIKPNDIVFDAKGKVIGYAMSFVKDTYALCQFFPKAFRDRNGISPDMALALVRKLQDLIKHIHDHHILVVDLNEMNFLLSRDFKEIFAIDCSSYQTTHYPATAIMESVRDRHLKTFSELTDWFSFGIVSFQMFSSIHPYKGKHLTVKGLDERMEKNISVFNKDVSVPATCYPFNLIPRAYLDWYKAVFEDGKRMPPPVDLNVAAVAAIVQVKKIIGSNNFIMAELINFAENIIKAKVVNGDRIVLTDKWLYLNKRQLCEIKPNCEIIYAPKIGTVIMATIIGENLYLYNATYKREIPISLIAHDMMEYGGRLYIKSYANILEIDFNEIGNEIIPSFKVVGNILEHAAQFFDGVVVQNLLGNYFVSLLPESGKCYQIKIKEFDGYRIIDAKFDKGVLMAVGTKAGKYNKFILRFDAIPNEYDIRMVMDIHYDGLNFTTTDGGLCVHLTENEEIEIFSARRGSAQIKIIDDAAIDGNMLLYNNGNKIEFAKGNGLHSISTKGQP